MCFSAQWTAGTPKHRTRTHAMMVVHLACASFCITGKVHE